MNKKAIRIAGLAFGLSMAVAGIGIAVGVAQKAPIETKADAGDTVLTFSSASVVTASSYDAYETDEWSLNAGGNNASAGWNKTAANAKQVGSTYAIDATNVTSTTYGWVAATKNAQANVGGLTFVYTGGSGNTSGKLWLGYSTDGGTTYSKVTLTSGTQGMACGSTNTTYTFEFDTIASAKYAIIVTGGTSGSAFRFDSVTATLKEGATGTSYTVTDSITNGSLSSTAKVAEDAALNLTISSEEHYTLPSSVSVTIGGEAYTGHTYTRNEGNRTASFSIPSGVIKGNVVVSGACVEDAKYSVTYSAGANGRGSNYVVSNQYEGSYTLVAFATTGLSADEGFRFDHYEVGGVEYDPGESITLSSNAIVTAVFSSLPGSFTIDKDTLTKPNSGSGYAAYNGTRSIDGYDILTNQVMIQSEKVQFQNSASAYMYNTTAFANGIRMIKTVGTKTVTVSFDDDTVGSGSTSIGTEVSAITVGGANYYIPTISDAKYFHIVSKKSATDTMTSIEVLDDENAAKAFAEMYLAAYTCNSNGTAEPSLNSGYTKALISSLYDAFECTGDTVQGLLQNAADNHTEDYGTDKVKEFGQRYYWILKNHYVADNTYDFMGRVTAGKISLSSSNAMFGSARSSDDNTPLVLALIVGSGIIAAGGLFLIARKRKQN